MEIPKKRKREPEPEQLPRVTYNTGNRIFDRLFKEESLDDMKNVVRRKLDLSHSTPVHFSQLREGKPVDLEDDEDFEAFVVSVRSSLAVKVNVILGNNGSGQITQGGLPPVNGGFVPIPTHEEFDISVSGRRKRKQKSGGEHDGNVSVVVTSPSDSSPEPPLEQPSKKRRVSFVEASIQKSIKDIKQSSQKPPESLHAKSSNSVLTSRSQSPERESVPRDREAGKAEYSVEKPKKEKKRKEKDKTLEGIGTEKEDKTMDGSAHESSEPTEAAPNVIQPKKSMKRPRSHDIAENKNTAKKHIEPSVSPDKPESERPKKQSKKKGHETADPTTIAPSEISTTDGVITKLQTKSQPSPSQPLPTPILPPIDSVDPIVDQSKKSQKAKSKKSKIAEPSEMEQSENHVPLKKVKKSIASKSTEMSVDEEDSTKSTQKNKKSKDKGEVEVVDKVKQNESLKETSTKATETSTPAPGDVPATVKPPQKSKTKTKEIEGKSPEPVAETTALPTEVNKPKKASKKKGADDTSTKAGPLEAIDASEHVAAQKEAPSTLPPEGQSSDSATHRNVKKGAKKESKDVSTKSSQTKALEKGTPKPEKPSSCFICNESPFHARSKCPIIKSGIGSCRKKIAELEADESEDTDGRRVEVIAELQTWIEKKQRHNSRTRVSETAKRSESIPEKASGPEIEAVPEPESESEHEVVPPTISSALKSPPSTQSRSAKPSALTQPSSQLPISMLASSSNKAASSSQAIKELIPKPLKITEGFLQTDFLGFGDISRYSDKDLEALVRGPRPSLKNIPSSDSEDDSDDNKEDAVLEEEQREPKVPRNASRIEYPSSSDADDDDEDDDDEDDKPSAKGGEGSPGQSHATTQPQNPLDLSAAEEAEAAKNLSFRDINSSGSSSGLDMTIDDVVNNIVDADLGPSEHDKLLNDTSPGNEEAESEYSAADTSGQKQVVPEQNNAPIDTMDVDVDPIESSDELADPLLSQPEPIVSDNDAQMTESTPKPAAVTRTRSQRSKVNGIFKVPEHPTTQPSQLNDASETPLKVTKKTRSLMKITEIPVPPRPAVRVIRAAPTTTPRTRRQIAAAQENQERDATPELEPVKKTRSATASVKAPKAKTPARTTRATKSTAKPQSRSSVPGDETTTFPTPGPSSQPAGVVDSESEHGRDTGVSTGDVSLAQWNVLQESASSQADTEGAADNVDELLYTPGIIGLKTPRNRKGQSMSDIASPVQATLFIPADSQQSFPYSQFPDIPPATEAPVSPNDSDDEDEVLATVVKPSTATSLFRSLKEIASQPTNFLRPRLSQFSRKAEEPVDMYGKTGQESEEESSSDSDSEVEHVSSSHIPPTRLAGATRAKK